MKDFLKYVFATITGMIIISVIMGIIGVISLIGLAASTSSTIPVEENTVFTLTLDGIVQERGQDNPMGLLTSGDMGTIGLNDIVKSIKKAKDNDDIKGIYLEAGRVNLDSYASMHAIREALVDFKKSGKWVIAYGDSYTQPAYYICSVADKVYMNPQGMVEWYGLAAEPMFLKDMLEKFGLKYQLCKVGKYKSAPETMTADGMSEPNREQITAYLNGVWNVMLKDVSASRKVSVDSLNAYADRFIAFSDPKDMVKAHLVDELIYTDQVKDVIKKKLAIDKDDYITQLTLTEMKDVAGKKNMGDEVAVYYAVGNIVDTDPSGFNSSEESIVGTTVCKDLEELANDDDVKAVVLRVNSPGGSAYASEQIWHAVMNLKAKKPVVVSMGGYAASGGYYISCAANYIYSEPTTITGSIGIFGMFLNYSGLMKDKLGIKFDEVKTNKHSNFGSQSRLFNAEELAILDKYIDRGYKLFRQRVADGRHLPVDQVEAIAQGRVWLGTDAIGIKLVDGIGSLDDAIKKAAQLAKLDEYYASEYPDMPGFMDRMLNSANSSKDNYLNEQMRLMLGELYEPFRYVKSAKEMGSIQARLPYFMTIR